MEHNAIIIDTSIFMANGLRLEKGLLKTVSQFNRTSIDFLMPDVIKNEILTHLEEKISQAQQTLKKSLQEAEDHLFFDGSTLNSAMQTLADTEQVSNLARTRLNNFIEATGAIEIACGDYTNVHEVLDFYFKTYPPFSKSGPKKCEFPDAIVLLAVEHWAAKESKKVLAITKDKDWEKYCNDSQNIVYEDDLGTGLSLFNQKISTEALPSRIKSAIESDNANGFIQKIKASLKSQIDGFIPYQKATSHLIIEAEGAHGWFNDFKFNDSDFKIIDSDDEYVVLEANVNISYTAEGDFSLDAYDSIDHDTVNIGSVTESVDGSFDTNILITITGDNIGDVDDFNIDDIEILDMISEVDFGEITIDLSDDE